MKKDNQKLYKTLLVIFLIIIAATPFGINYAYLQGTADGIANTVFTASDMISFYGSVLAFLGATLLGCVSLIQNKKLHQKNEALQMQAIEIQKKQIFEQKNQQKALFFLESVSTLSGTKAQDNGGFFSITISKGRYPNAFQANNLKLVLINGGNYKAQNLNESCLYDDAEKPIYKILNEGISIGGTYNIIISFQLLLDNLKTIRKPSEFGWGEFEELYINKIYSRKIAIKYQNLNGIEYEQFIKLNIEICEDCYLLDIHKISGHLMQEVYKDE